MLRLENLAKLYGLKVVFKGVSCRFTAGSITLLARFVRYGLAEMRLEDHQFHFYPVE
jgi:hypothetical protein